MWYSLKVSEWLHLQTLHIFLYCMHGISFCTACMVYLSVLHVWYIFLYCMHGISFCTACMVYLSVQHVWYIFLYYMHGISFCTACMVYLSVHACMVYLSVLACMVYLSVQHAWYIFRYCMNRLNQWHYLHYIYVQFFLHVLDYTNSSILSSWHSSNQQSSAMCLNYITN